MYLNSQLFTDGSARTYTLNSLLMALLFVFESLILVHAMDNTIEGLVALRRTKPCMSIEVFLLSCAPYCTVNNSLSYSMHDRSVASGLQCLHIEADLGILITSSLLSISFLHHDYIFLFPERYHLEISCWLFPSYLGGV